MNIQQTCTHCHAQLSAPAEFANRRMRCPHCHQEILMAMPNPPQPKKPPVILESATPLEVQFLESKKEATAAREFVEPTTDQTSEKSATENHPEENVNWKQRLIAALLDPRSIRWLLVLGGVLMFGGALIWLIGQGVFDNPWVVAATTITGSIGVTVLGWLAATKTRYITAGKALSFVGCVCLALNLWLLHAQNLITLDGGLWIGGVVCILFYIATARLLRDPVFMYAVQAGVTLTSLLMLGDLGLAGNLKMLVSLFMGLAVISIHSPLAFPDNTGDFSRTRFGTPLLISGHVQLAAALSVLIVGQAADLLASGINIGDGFTSLTSVAEPWWFPAFVWLGAAYLYLFSDIAVRRFGLFIYLAAVSVVMCEVSLLAIPAFGVEALAVALALTAMALSLVIAKIRSESDRFARIATPLAVLLSVAPILFGIVVHLQHSFSAVVPTIFALETTWIFVIAMLIVAIANGVSVVAFRKRNSILLSIYLLFSAVAATAASAGTLCLCGQASCVAQAPLLMLLPFAYLVASRVGRGKSLEKPTVWVAHSIAAVVLIRAGLESAALLQTPDQFVPHALLTVTGIVATAFYALARQLSRSSALNSYLAAIAASFAMWQCLLYFDVDQHLFMPAFASVGLLLLVIGRLLGVQREESDDRAGQKLETIHGRGLEATRCGNVILTLSWLAASMYGLFQLFGADLRNSELIVLDWFTLGSVTVSVLVAACVNLEKVWRRTYAVEAVCIAAILALSVQVGLDISGYRKLEIAFVLTGLALLTTGYVGHLRESRSEQAKEIVSFNLWTGSVLATSPLLIAVFATWGTGSLLDPVTLLAITLATIVTGIIWRVKAPTLMGGITLAVYLVSLLVTTLYQPQIAMGIYLAVGGAIVFAIGLTLAICRDHLLTISERIAKRDGVFQVIDWR